MSLWLKADMNYIFQMRYCKLFYVKRLQKFQRPNLKKKKKWPTRPDSTPPHPGLGWTGRFFFDLHLWPLMFLQPLNQNKCFKMETTLLWNSDHVVLKLNIHTSTSPWQQRSNWGVTLWELLGKSVHSSVSVAKAKLDFKTTWLEFQMPSQTASTVAKPRCVYSILKPHGQSSRYQVRLPPPRRSRGTYTQF